VTSRSTVFSVMLTTIASCAQDDIDCDSLSPKECAEHSDACSTISGRRYDDTNQCMLPREILGCTEENRPCDTAIHYMLDADGQCWRFSSGCIPESFDSDPATCPPASWVNQDVDC
jgi:hypothetical protein